MKKASTIDSQPLVSVVIITRERVKELQRCIGSILASTYENFQVVILDNSDEDSRKLTVDYLSGLSADQDVEYLVCPPRGFAEMRQFAFEHTIGEIIMSIDDDCCAEKDSITQIVKRFKSDEMIGIVGGQIVNVGFEGRDRFKGRGKISLNGKYEAVQNPEEAEIFGGANMSLRSVAIEQARGYDSFFAGGLEEADITLSIKSLGYRIVYEPAVRITHYHSDSRFRDPLRNLDVLRLYLFFKHYMPDNARTWMEFLKVELVLVGKDCRQLVNNVIAQPSLRRDALKLYKIIAARLMIPYLIFKALRIRKQA